MRRESVRGAPAIQGRAIITIIARACEQCEALIEGPSLTLGMGVVPLSGSNQQPESGHSLSSASLHKNLNI